VQGASPRQRATLTTEQQTGGGAWQTTIETSHYRQAEFCLATVNGP
jgi:hypothetical protein